MYIKKKIGDDNHIIESLFEDYSEKDIYGEFLDNRVYKFEKVLKDISNKHVNSKRKPFYTMGIIIIFLIFISRIKINN